MHCAAEKNLNLCILSSSLLIIDILSDARIGG